jgi:HEAT repeat protein
VKLPAIIYKLLWHFGEKADMTDEQTVFCSSFIRAVENIEFPTSIWRYLLENVEDLDANHIQELEKAGFPTHTVKEHLRAINALDTEALIAKYMLDDDASDAARAALQLRVSSLNKDRAIALIRSQVSRERLLGVNMITFSLGRGFEDEVVSELFTLVKKEEDEQVLEAICYALYQLGAEDRVPHLQHLVVHESANVRYALATCLFGSDEPDAIALQMTLARDEDSEVRNWAVTGLGKTVLGADEKEELAYLKPLFKERLTDSNKWTRLEAVAALSRFAEKNEQVLNSLLVELTKDNVSLLALDAARSFADPRLSSALTCLQKSFSEDEPMYLEVEHALAACQLSINS